MVKQAKFGYLVFSEIPQIVISNSKYPIFNKELFPVNGEKRFYHQIKVNIEPTLITFMGKEMLQVDLNKPLFVTNEELENLNIDFNEIKVARVPGDDRLKLMSDQVIRGFTETSFRCEIAGQYTFKFLDKGTDISERNDLDSLLEQK